MPPICTASHDPQVRSREVHFENRARSQNRSLEQREGGGRVGEMEVENVRNGCKLRLNGGRLAPGPKKSLTRPGVWGGKGAENSPQKCRFLPPFLRYLHTSGSWRS